MAGFTMDIVRGNVGEKIDRSQQRPLGDRVLDTLGRTWTYIRLDGTFTFGHLLRDSTGVDLIGATRTVSGDVAVGATRLLDSGVFTEAIAKNIIGSLGFITGGDGVGQTFVITERFANQDDEIGIKCLTGITSDPTEVDGDGWVTALDSTSTYDIVLPGAARLAVAASNSLRGWIQQDTQSTDEGRFAYALARGPGFGILDSSGTAAVAGGPLTPAAAAKLAGASGTTNRVVARALLGDLTGGTDGFIPIEAQIDNEMIAFGMVSYAHPIDQHLDIR